MRTPDFIVIGHLKCGSTSLSSYMAAHPDIYIKHDFEPKYISSQFVDYPQNGPGSKAVDYWVIKDKMEYLRLFEGRNESLVGENSSELFYYASQAAPLIKNTFGDIRIIVLLRNPVKRAFSAYMHMVRDQREPLSFAEAMSVEADRIKDNWDTLYYYREGGFYHDRLETYLKSFSRVHLICTEELASDQEAELRKLCAFMDVPFDKGMLIPSRYNVSGIPRWPWLRHQMMNDQSILRRLARPVARTVFNPALRSRLFNRMLNANLEKRELEASLQDSLKATYGEDVKKLSRLTGKNMSALWGF